MIRGNRASFSVYSDTKTVNEISVMLGLEPTRSGDKGDLTPAGRAGRDLAPERLRYQQTHWSLSVVNEPSEEDQTGFSSLRELMAMLQPSSQVLAELRQGGETRLWWSGDSDSTQGGFVLEADLISYLAKLGCDVFGTAYLAENDEDEDAMSDGDVVEFRIGSSPGGFK
jgi:hypothetical protein